MGRAGARCPVEGRAEPGGPPEEAQAGPAQVAGLGSL